MVQKLAFTKPTYNVLTETDVNNFSFDSQYDTLKYFASGTGNQTIQVTGSASGEATIRIRHNLGYYPYFQVYVNQGLSSRLLPNACVPVVDTGISCAYATTTDLFLYIRQEVPDAGETDTAESDYVFKIFTNDLGL